MSNRFNFLFKCKIHIKYSQISAHKRKRSRKTTIQKIHQLASQQQIAHSIIWKSFIETLIWDAKTPIEQTTSVLDSSFSINLSHGLSILTHTTYYPENTPTSKLATNCTFHYMEVIYRNPHLGCKDTKRADHKCIGFLIFY